MQFCKRALLRDRRIEIFEGNMIKFFLPAMSVFFAVFLCSAPCKAFVLKTTVTATIASVEGDSSIRTGEDVSFVWVYDINSRVMHRHCGKDCVHETYDYSKFQGFSFLSDAKLTLSPGFEDVVPTTLFPVTHSFSHETVVYGGMVNGEAVFRYVNKCSCFYLSLFDGGPNTGTMTIFDKKENPTRSVAFDLSNLRFSTTLADDVPDPQLATELLSRERILDLAERGRAAAK